MKKLSVLFASLALAVCFIVSEASAQSVNAGFGIGASYPKAPEAVGFDSSVFVDFGLNQFFAVGLESGFGWIRRTSGESIPVGDLPGKLNKSTNLYSIPLLATVTVFIPVSEYGSGVLPYISGGAGYSWTTYSGQMHETFHGFTYQAVVGANIDLGSGGNGMMVFIEGGYRGTMIEAQIERQNLELDMSGFFGKVGVSFPLVAGNW